MRDCAGNGMVDMGPSFRVVTLDIGLTVDTVGRRVKLPPAVRVGGCARHCVSHGEIPDVGP
jgi:hypothetical protein